MDKSSIFFSKLGMSRGSERSNKSGVRGTEGNSK
jgi:hypothetical protein